jgi:hypothetical protein
MIDVFEKSSSLTIPMVEAAIHFLTVFPARRFVILQIFEAKLERFLNSEAAFLFIQKMEKYPIFPVQIYWERLFPLLCDPQEPTNLKVQLVKALATIVRADDQDQREKLNMFLFSMHDDSLTKNVVISALEELDDSLLPYFEDRTMFMLLVSLMNQQSKRLRLGIVSVLKRLSQFSSIMTFNFFYTLFDRMKNEFEQCTDLTQKRKLSAVWPELLDAGGDLLVPFSERIADFFLNQLTLDDRANRSPNQFIALFERKNSEQQVMKIRIAVMKSIQILVSRRFEIPNIQKVITPLIDQLRSCKQEKTAIAALETLRIVFRSYGSKDVNVCAVHKQLYKFVVEHRTRRILGYVLRVLGTIGTQDPMTFRMSDSSMALDKYPLWTKVGRESCYLKVVMKCIQDHLTENTSDPSGLLNAIVYIFQFDSGKSREYLDPLINILAGLLRDSRENADNLPCDSIFYVLTTIILQVKIEIQPFAQNLVSMVQPFLQPDRLSLAALKTLSAIVFALKSCFEEFAIPTFCQCLALLKQKISDSDCILYLLQILTHLIIFCRGSHRLLLREIEKEVLNQNSLNLPYCLSFLSQVITGDAQDFLLLPSLKLAMSILRTGDDESGNLRPQSSSITKACLSLLSLLSETIPEFVRPTDIERLEQRLGTKARAASGIGELTADPYPQRSPPRISPLQISGILKNFAHDQDHTDLLLSLYRSLVLCSSSPAIRACYPLLQGIPELAGYLFPWVLLSVLDTLDRADQKELCDQLISISLDPKLPIDLLGAFTDAFDLLDRADYLMCDSALAGELAQRWDHLFHAVRFYERSTFTSDAIKCRALDIDCRLHRREAALGILSVTDKIENKAKILQRLSLWSEARRSYDPRLEEGALVSYCSYSTKIADWNDIADFFDRFAGLSPEATCQCALFFAMAARNLKVDVHQFLHHAPKDDAYSCLF